MLRNSFIFLFCFLICYPLFSQKRKNSTRISRYDITEKGKIALVGENTIIFERNPIARVVMKCKRKGYRITSLGHGKPRGFESIYLDNVNGKVRFDRYLRLRPLVASDKKYSNFNLLEKVREACYFGRQEVEYVYTVRGVCFLEKGGPVRSIHTEHTAYRTLTSDLDCSRSTVRR